MSTCEKWIVVFWVMTFCSLVGGCRDDGDRSFQNFTTLKNSTLI